jgi:hypothetical protein
VFDDKYVPLAHVSKALKIDKEKLMKDYQEFIVPADPKYRGFGNTHISHVMTVEGVKKVWPEFDFEPKGSKSNPLDIFPHFDPHPCRTAIEEYKQSEQFKIDAKEYYRNTEEFQTDLRIYLEEKMNKALIE